MVKRFGLFFVAFYLILAAINASDVTKLLKDNKAFEPLAEKVQSRSVCNAQEAEFLIDCFQRQTESFFTPANNVMALIRIQGFYQKYFEMDLSYLASTMNPGTVKRVFDYQLNYLRMEMNMVESLRQIAESEQAFGRLFKLQSHINRIMGKFFVHEWLPTLSPFIASVKKYQSSSFPLDSAASTELDKMQARLVQLQPILEKGYELNFFQQELYERLHLLIRR